VAGVATAVITVDADGRTTILNLAATELTLGADPADAGVVRLENDESIMAEASPAGTDIDVIHVNSDERIVMGETGTGGSTLSIPDITIYNPTPYIMLDDENGANGRIDVDATDADDATMTLAVDDSTGNNVVYVAIDGVTETIKLQKIVAVTPQSITYDDDTNTDQTIGTDLLSSVILVTGDNDSNNDSVDLQDGVVAGQTIKFVGVALIDADDTFEIDAETDSTCTGCPGAGIFTFDDPGDSVSLYWGGAAWFYLNSYEVD